MRYMATLWTDCVLPKEVLRAFVGPVVLVALLLAQAGVARAELLAVQNAGFESPVLLDGAWSVTLPGWEFAPGSFGAGGAFNPTTSQFFDQASEGQNAAWSAGGEIFQNLDYLLLPNTTYTLQVDVGNRLDTPYAGYRIRFATSFVGGLNGVVLAEDHDTVTPAGGTFETATLSFITRPTPAELGEQLQISLYGIPGDNTQTVFDNVRLDATPTPEPTGMIGLLSMLFVGLVGYVWRRGRTR